MEISLQEREMMAYSAGIKAALQSAKLVVDEQGRLLIWATDGDEDVFKFVDSSFLAQNIEHAEVFFLSSESEKRSVSIRSQVSGG